MAEAVRQLPLRGGKFLDVCCQAGHLINAVKTLFRERVGVDLGSYAEHWATMITPNSWCAIFVSRYIPFPSGCFDVVTCFMVLEHVFDVFGAVEDIARLTRPGGYVILEVPNAAYFKHIFELVKGRVPRTGSQRYPFTRVSGWDGQHLHYFTLHEISWLCDEFGLTTVNHKSRGRYQCLRSLFPSLLYASIVLVLCKVVE